jgi:hypothetical protein
MKATRVSIAGMMGLILVVAVGLAGLKEGTYWWAWASVTLTVLALLVASLNAMFRPRRARPFWAAFALFGLTYLMLNFAEWSVPTAGNLGVPTAWLLDELHPRIHPIPEYEPDPNPMIVQLALQRITPRLKPGSKEWGGHIEYYRQVGHSLAALAFATLGGLGARFAYAPRRSRRQGAGDERQ